MSRISTRPWYFDPSLLRRKVGSWMLRRRPELEVGHASEWLGWDAWVNTSGKSRRASH